LLHLLTITIGLLIALGLEGYDTHQIRLDFTMGDLKSASWKTAAATGALGFMEYDQVQRYSAVYQLQDKYSALQDRTIDEFLQLQSYVIYGFDPKKCGRSELLYAGMSKVRAAWAYRLYGQ
jgi:hypothetical protein